MAGDRPPVESAASVPTILVVDDERPVREFICMALEEDGYRVLQASHGQDALDVAARERPDLILADVMMPLMTGVELSQRLHADPKTANIPIILTSAGGAAAAAGGRAAAFLGKPFDLDELDDLIRATLPSQPKPGKRRTA